MARTNKTPEPPHSRPLTSFSLRSALVAITALAVWLGLHMRSVRKQQASVEAVQLLGGEVYYDFQLGRPTAESPSPQWLVETLGVDHLHSVAFVNLDSPSHGEAYYQEILGHFDGFPGLEELWLKPTNEELKHVGPLTNLRALVIFEVAEIDESGLAHLADLKKLESLHLHKCQIADGSLRPLGRLPKLEHLSLMGTGTTDEDLAHLEHLVQLRTLNLTGTNATEEGLRHLVNLKNLKVLRLKGTAVKDASWLQERLPNCKIHF